MTAAAPLDDDREVPPRLRRALHAAASRLRQGVAAGVACALLALGFDQVDRLPDHLEWIARHGVRAFPAHWLTQDLLPSLIIAAVTLLTLKLGTHDGHALVRHPLRFVVLLAGGAALGILCGWELEVALGHVPALRSPDFDWTRLYEAWTSALLWGGLAGWLYALLRRREEDARRFALLLARRSLVARQLAHSRLATARTQLDPTLVTETLREIRARYHAADDAGGRRAIELMDSLVRTLRLALDRGDAGPAAQRRRAVAWIELIALRADLVLRVEPGAGHEAFVLTGAALTPALGATLAGWARDQAGILHHGPETASAYVIHLAH